MTVREQMRGPVLVVTLDRPEAKNALDGATITALRELFEGIAARAARAADATASAADARPHALVLGSEGDVFCAGGDLGDMRRLGAAGFDENLEAAREMGAMFRAIRLCPVPVVARVQGPAYGGGVGLAAACDVVVASQEARFAFTEVRLGLVAGVIAPLVVGRIGVAAARHYFLTGDPIRAVDALRIGLVDRLAERDGLDAAVARTVESLLRGGPAALGRIKALVEGTVALGFDGSLDFTARMIAEARTGAEAQAALAAFFAKEPAPWARDVSWPPAD
jgi:methylglutaconyl-CoA hydratase